MKRIYFLLFYCFICFYVCAQKDTAFIYTYGGMQDDVCNQVRATPDGGYIMIGTTSSFGKGSTSFYVVKTDSLLNHQWSAAYGGNLNQAGYAVTTTYDKGYAFAGFTSSFGSGGYDVYVVRTDSAGNIIWQKTYGGADWDFGYSIQQTHDSGFVICGQTYSYGAGNGDVYVIKIDKNGDTLWTRAIGGTGYEAGNSILVQGDSLYIIAGCTTSFGKADTNAYFIELDKQGNIITTKTYGSRYTSIAYSIAPTLDKGYIIIGSMDSIYKGIAGEMMLKTDAAGNCQWMTQITNGTWNDIGKDVIEATDSTYLSIGSAAGGGYGSSSMHIMRHSPTGYYLAGPSIGGTGTQWGNSIASVNTNNMVFAGATTSYGQGGCDVYAIRVKSDSIVQNYALVIKSYNDTGSVTGITPNYDINTGVKIFPNPMSTTATVLLQGEEREYYTLRLYNTNGQCILKNKPFIFFAHGQYIAHIEKGNLQAGIYFFSIYTKNGVIAKGKLMIE